MENAELISRIINTLGTITVSGKDNLSKLLGCISALEELQNGINARSEVKTDG